jgi:hypothetical protein
MLGTSQNNETMASNVQHGREKDDGRSSSASQNTATSATSPTSDCSHLNIIQLESGPATVNKDANAIPNGGTLAWLQVLGSFFLWMNTW